MRVLIFAFVAGVCCPAWGAYAACPSTTTTQFTMAIQLPCVDTIVTHNRKTSPGLQGVAISDASATLAPSAHSLFQVQAPGMVNVEVWTHGGFAVRLVNDGLGTFSGTLDLSHELEGPISAAVVAWNAPAGDNSYTVELAARMTIVVNPATWYNWQVIPPQAGGMSIKWIDRLGNLSATPCKPKTGVWPNCTKPTAADGFTWYENKPNGGDYGAAAFEHTDGAHNPFAILPAGNPGFLRIRSTYDPTYVDPYGFKRLWYTGFLATAFPDGTTNVPMGNGYYEIRALMPPASCSSTCGGGTWPSFFMQTLNAMKTACKSGDIEEDITEQYGNNPSYMQMGQHPYCGATGADSLVYAGDPEDLTWDMHRYGLLVTNTTISVYLDDKFMASAPRDQLVGGVAPQWFLMTTLAMGGGWPVNPPPAGYYDMWIDYVRYLAP